MARYIARPPRATRCDSDWYEPPLEPAITVIEREPVPTGLFDEHGFEIWRLPERIGF